MRLIRLYRFMILLAFAIVVSQAMADEQSPTPLMPADTSSPRATLRSFLDAQDDVYRLLLAEQVGFDAELEGKSHVIDRIIDCLDTSELPPSIRTSAAREAAICLKEVFDRIDLPVETEIPDIEDIKAAEADGRKLDRWTVPETRITIAKKLEGPQQGQYLFTSDTVSEATGYFERVRHLPYKEPEQATRGFHAWYLSNAGPMIPDAWLRSLPDWTRKRVGGQVVWKWIGLLLTSLVAILLMVVSYFLGRRLSKIERGFSLVRYLCTWMFPVAAMLIPLGAQYFVASQLNLTGPPLAIATTTFYIVFLLSLFAVVMSGGNRIAEIIIATPKIHPKGIDAQLIRLVSKVISLVAAVVVVLEGGRYLGIPVTTLMAGAGVGGLAFALAAQDTLKGLLGSMAIVLDKPYRVGERIVTKNYDGVVEEIGLRSTKIRLLTGHQVTIPNEELARSEIENIGRRPHIRRVTDIRIPLDTPPAKAELAVQLIRDILDNHEGMPTTHPPRVYLSEFNPDSLNVRMMYWYEPADYWQFLDFGQRINLKIMNAFHAEGIKFALPSSKMIMSSVDQDALLDSDRGAEADSNS